jgi:hypothetical protein
LTVALTDVPISIHKNNFSLFSKGSNVMVTDNGDDDDYDDD